MENGDGTRSGFAVRNERSGRCLGDRIEHAARFHARARGLLGRATFDEGEGLWIEPCSSVHMFFMRFPIDVLFLDRERRVRRTVSSLGPWRIAVGGLRTHSTLELPTGAIAASDTRAGDRLAFEPVRFAPHGA